MTSRVHPSQTEELESFRSLDSIQSEELEGSVHPSATEKKSSARDIGSPNRPATVRSSKDVSLFSYQEIDEDGDIETQLNLVQKQKKNNNNNTIASSKKELSISQKLLKFPFPQSHGISDDLFLHSMYSYPMLRKLLLFIVILILICIGYFTAYVYTTNFQTLTTTDYKNPGVIPTYRLTFIGDSLIHRPFTEFDLGGRVQRYFRTINLNITDHARNGQEIAECESNVYDDVPIGSADMVILFWDSDCSNVDESAMDDDEIRETRANYKANLTEVINAVKSAGVTYMAISGPNLLGEGTYSFLRTIWMTRWADDKSSMLDDYRKINEDIANELDVDYIDMRKAFLRAEPTYWVYPAYRLTLDGEHPNDRGTGIIAKQFAMQISAWTGAPLRS